MKHNPFNEAVTTALSPHKPCAIPGCVRQAQEYAHVLDGTPYEFCGAGCGQAALEHARLNTPLYYSMQVLHSLRYPRPVFTEVLEEVMRELKAAHPPTINEAYRPMPVRLEDE